MAGEMVLKGASPFKNAFFFLSNLPEKSNQTMERR
jgi:hypothetical protein